MDEANQRLFNSMDLLRKAAYDSFNDRRVYEWKLNIAIWTAQAILIAGLLQPAEPGEELSLGNEAWIIASILGAGIVFFHMYWSHFAARANAIDKGFALYYSRTMHKMLGLSFDQTLQDRINNHPTLVGWYQWSHFSQIAITFTLAVAAVILVAVRSTC